jgi:folylpolyglutamate synthase/dihydropteroate synthase
VAIFQKRKSVVVQDKLGEAMDVVRKDIDADLAHVEDSSGNTVVWRIKTTEGWYWTGDSVNQQMSDDSGDAEIYDNRKSAMKVIRALRLVLQPDHTNKDIKYRLVRVVKKTKP